MTSKETYNYLGGWFAEGMRKAYAESYGKKATKHKELQGYGQFGDFKPWVQNMLWELFDRVALRGKEHYLLADGSGRCVYAYNGKHYERIDNPKGFVRELVRMVLRQLEIGLNYMGCAEKIGNELISTITSSDEFRYKPDRRYIAFNNGAFDLKDGKLKGHDARYVTDIVLDFDYRNEKECNMMFRDVCKLWDNFICNRETGVFTNPKIAADFQAFCGAFLMNRDDFKFEYMACIHGPGSNGKSVLVDAVSGVFGEEYYSTFTPKQLFKEGTSSSFCVSDLEGKLLNIVGDLDRADFSGGDFKRFISGEKIRAREPYGKAFRFVKPPIMICCCNEFPETGDDSEGHHRRLLPFESTRKMWTEKDKDTTLTARLTTPEARAYIFTWMYKGYRRIINNDNKLPLSDDTLKAQERLKANANSMRRWFAGSDYDVPKDEKDGFWKPLKELYAEYKAYCEDNNYNKRSDRDLSRMLLSKGIQKDRHGIGTVFFVTRKEIESDIS